MTFVDAVAEYFRRRPNVWVNGMDLAQVGGCYAWRSRVSDCRRTGMTIENRQRPSPGGAVVSEYRFVPDRIADA